MASSSTTSRTPSGRLHSPSKRSAGKPPRRQLSGRSNAFKKAHGNASKQTSRRQGGNVNRRPGKPLARASRATTTTPNTPAPAVPNQDADMDSHSGAIPTATMLLPPLPEVPDFVGALQPECDWTDDKKDAYNAFYKAKGWIRERTTATGATAYFVPDPIRIARKIYRPFYTGNYTNVFHTIVEAFKFSADGAASFLIAPVSFDAEDACGAE